MTPTLLVTARPSARAQNGSVLTALIIMLGGWAALRESSAQAAHSDGRPSFMIKRVWYTYYRPKISFVAIRGPAPSQHFILSVCSTANTSPVRLSLLTTSTTMSPSQVATMPSHHSLHPVDAPSCSSCPHPPPFSLSPETWKSFSLDKRRRLTCLANSIALVQKRMGQTNPGELAELPSISRPRN